MFRKSGNRFCETKDMLNVLGMVNSADGLVTSRRWSTGFPI